VARPARIRSEPASRWTRQELAVLRRLTRPALVQAFVDDLAYRAEDDPGCPRRVIAEHRANCYDGAIFAAAALRRLGYPPLLVDLRAVRDDDHVLAVFRERGRWGAVAKSNFAGLRYREPVHRDLRELAMSYFDDYFNARGERTLREYSVPLDLRLHDGLDWTFRDEHLPHLAGVLDGLPHRALLTRAMVRALTRVDGRSLAAGMVGTDPAGLFAGA
jgi:hypothetical protein